MIRRRRRTTSADEAVPLSSAQQRARQNDRVLAWGRLMTAVIALGLVVVIARVVQLKVAPDPRLLPAVGTTISTRSEMGRRGMLLDRRGRIISMSSIGYRLFVDPQTVADLNTVAIDITDLIGGDPVDIDRIIQPARHLQYVPVTDLLGDWQVEAIRSSGLRGVGLERRLVRHKPHGEVGSGVVGRVGFEHQGQSGFEHMYDSILEPSHGRLAFLRDARRRALWVEPEGYQPARDGREVQLSIDLLVQELVERRLEQAVADHRATAGRVVVLDARSGEILAMGDILNRKRPDAPADPLREKDPALGRNRCATDPYEPGSTFKPFIWAAAISMGKVTAGEMLDCPESGGWRTPYGRLIRDTHYYGRSSWETVLIKSMNTGMAMIAERLTWSEMQRAIGQFGFGHRTNCGLPGESAGIVTTPGKWTKYTQSSVSFGHEVAVTPLQMARAFSVFARDGTLPELRTTVDPFVQRRAPLIYHAITEDAALRTRSIMRRVMTEGTGRKAQSEKYRIFGKSGTPQLPRADGKGYHEDRYLPSFVGAAPLDDPRIVVVCVLEDPDPETGYYGGECAGPVVRDIIDETLAYLGIEPDVEPDDDAPTE